MLLAPVLRQQGGGFAFTPTGTQTPIDFPGVAAFFRETDKLTASLRELADHLTGYAICATNFDEDAVIAVEKAERLLADAEKLA